MVYIFPSITYKVRPLTWTVELFTLMAYLSPWAECQHHWMELGVAASGLSACHSWYGTSTTQESQGGGDWDPVFKAYHTWERVSTLWIRAGWDKGNLILLVLSAWNRAGVGGEGGVRNAGSLPILKWNCSPRLGAGGKGSSCCLGHTCPDWSTPGRFL